MILYLETSNLVKLYVEEEGTGEVKSLVSGADIVATSIISYVELRAALSRKFREGGIEKPDYELIKREFEGDWEKYFILDVSRGIIKTASGLAEKHGLRGFDAIHLASALSLKKRSATPVIFSSTDARLNRAAGIENLKSEKN